MNTEIHIEENSMYIHVQVSVIITIQQEEVHLCQAFSHQNSCIYDASNVHFLCTPGINIISQNFHGICLK